MLAGAYLELLAVVPRELITVIECCEARLKPPVPMVVFKGTAYNRGWQIQRLF